MDKLNIGVIGVLGRGGIARHSHSPEDGIRIIAGADVYEDKLAIFSEKYQDDGGVDTYTDYRRLLERKDIDAVFICSPDFCHEEQALAALDAGKHIFLEKPMAITIDGCDKILKKAYQTKLKLYLGHNMRHMSFVQKMKEIIDKGMIGEVKSAWCRHFVGNGGDWYFKDWHADRTKSTSLLLQKAVHDIDVIHWICGGYSKRVTAMGALTVYGELAEKSRGDGSRVKMDEANWPPKVQNNFNPVVDVEDLNLMLMELDNGILCSYQQCHYTPDNWRNYTIIGTEGRLENFNDSPGNTVVRLWNKRRCQYNPYGDEQFYIPPAKGGHGGADPVMVKEFVRYVREGGKIKTSPIAARNGVAAGCQAAESLRNGSVPKEIPPVPKEIIEYFSAEVE